MGAPQAAGLREAAVVAGLRLATGSLPHLPVPRASRLPPVSSGCGAVTRVRWWCRLLGALSAEGWEYSVFEEFYENRLVELAPSFLRRLKKPTEGWVFGISGPKEILGS